MLSKKQIDDIFIFMKWNKITQQDLANKIGVSRQYLSEMFRRKVHNVERETQILKAIKEIKEKF